LLPTGVTAFLSKYREPMESQCTCESVVSRNHGGRAKYADKTIKSNSYNPFACKDILIYREHTTVMYVIKETVAPKVNTSTSVELMKI
jgi:hypothetical protein